MIVTPYTLSQSIQTIQNKYGRTIVMIEFEDGTGKSFNVRFSGDKHKTYIRLN